MSGERLTKEQVVNEFADFYTAVHADRKPYPWQERLVTFLVEENLWPDSISAPTGSGKTSVLDVHVFLNAMAGLGLIDADVPRRLVLSVGRRALVDSQFEEAVRLRHALAKPAGPILQRVRDGLELRAHIEGASGEWLPLASLRGGAHDDRTDGSDVWRLHPTACAILCMTRDMVGSRLLFRGYGASMQARPVETGLLSYDTVLVVDEAHLNEQLVTTARRLTDLERLATNPIGLTPLQVVSTTATQITEGGTSVAVTALDCEKDEALARRLSRPKPVTIIDVEHSLSDRRTVALVVDECLRLREKYGDGTVGCIVNTVDAAARIAVALRARVEDADVESLVGRMRPVDRDEVIRACPELFGVDGHGDGTRSLGFLVATQTMEVGVDADFAALVTELAPAPALTQRAGRVNRRGARVEGPISVVAPRSGARRGPYDDSDLERAREWLDTLDDRGLLAFGIDDVPPMSRRRRLLQRLEEWDAEYLSATAEQLSAESGSTGEGVTDLELYLSDDLDPDMDASLIVRDKLPADDALASRILTALPPLDGERFPVRLALLRRVLQGYLDGDSVPRPRVFRYVRTDTGEIQAQPARARDVRPGDTVVVDATAPLFLSKALVEEGIHPVDDVYAEAGGARRGGAFIVVRRGEHDELRNWRTWHRNLIEYTQRWEEDPIDAASFLADCVRDQQESSDAESWASIDPDGEIEMFGADGDVPNEIVVVSRPDGERFLDEEVRQAGRAKVLLAAHQEAVAERSAHLAAAVGLSSAFGRALEQAGAWHDEGKRDARFQVTLGRRARDQDEVWAKGRGGGRAALRALRSRSGLSRGWRHEQRSAAYVWSQRDGGDAAHIDLVTRLVGTSHGYGRGAFRDDAATLVPVSERSDSSLWNAAVELFDVGEWDALIERTHQRHGYWGTAYLEALLRVADMTVSADEVTPC